MTVTNNDDSAPAKRVKGLLFATSEPIASEPAQSEPEQSVETKTGESVLSEPNPTNDYTQKNTALAFRFFNSIKSQIAYFREKFNNPDSNKSNTSGQTQDIVVEKYNVNVTARDDMALTTLHDAAAANNPAAIVRLLKSGADVNAKDTNEMTPLHYVAHWNFDTLAKILIDAGASVNVKNKDGGTPLDQANANNSHAVADILKKANGLCSLDLFLGENLLTPFVVMMVMGILGMLVWYPTLALLNYFDGPVGVRISICG